MPEIIYKFENQNLLPYEDNLNFKGDFHLRHNFILGQMFNHGDSKMYHIFYCLIFGFYPKLTSTGQLLREAFLSHLNN